jgi:hypothetical protein
MGVLFAFGRAMRATDRVFLRHAQGNRFGLLPQSASSLLVSGKASHFRASREWRVAPPMRLKKDATRHFRAKDRK